MKNFDTKEEDFEFNLAKVAKEYDFIIVGQGIAGTCLAYSLLNKGKTVLVLDSDELPSSSQVAGGLYNPITGRNMVLTWKAMELFPYLDVFYSSIEEKLGIKLLHKLPIYRPLINTEEINEWQGRLSQDIYKPFIEKIATTAQYQDFIRNPLGGIVMKQTGFLDTKMLLAGFRQYLVETDSFKNENINYSSLNLNDEKIVYKEYSADKIIFCDGPLGFGSRMVENVKFHALKGEVLELEIDYQADLIVNRNAFVLPKEGKYIAGSNYDLKGNDWLPTDRARNEICEKIDKIIQKDYRIVGQRAGLRPTTHDRRPVLGMIPGYRNAGIFNGLGTKGVSLAPFYANQLSDYLVGRGEIDFEVKIDRYFN